MAARGDRQEPGHREEVEQKHPGNEKGKFCVIAENLTKAFRCLNHLLDHSRRVGVIHVALVSVCVLGRMQLEFPVLSKSSDGSGRGKITFRF